MNYSDACKYLTDTAKLLNEKGAVNFPELSKVLLVYSGDEGCAVRQFYSQLTKECVEKIVAYVVEIVDDDAKLENLLETSQNISKRDIVQNVIQHVFSPLQIALNEDLSRRVFDILNSEVFHKYMDCIKDSANFLDPTFWWQSQIKKNYDKLLSLYKQT
ncbi:Uncharacterised protein [Candidatus Tiddalikarchaeum anstoanum]|nr:Uncharacterised protein [Candidatus Tiddalikarchaeum anstoanum]